MTSGRSNLIDISAILAHETEKAFLLDVGTEENIWVPKSQCEIDVEEDDRLPGTAVIVTLPEWLAEKKGLI